MTKNHSKLLLLSNFPHFLADFTARLSEEYQVERANSENMLLFLCNEWEPHIVIIDGDSTFFNSIAITRDRVGYEKLGILVFSKELTPPREEKALRAGCDLILTQPSTYSGLQARITAVARRVLAHSNNALATSPARTDEAQTSFNEIHLLNENGIVKRGNSIVTASPLQFKLLQTFLINREQLLSRQFIREQVWRNAPISPRSIDAHISKLKRLLPELDDHLINIYGKGYIFTESRRQAA